MANNRPPSYDQTISKGDPFEFVAQYIDIRLYPTLSLVSKRFHDVFTPLFWNDPLNFMRQLGLETYRDREWLTRFEARLSKYPESARGRIRILDFRNFANEYMSLLNSPEFQGMLARLVRLLPRLSCVMLGLTVKFDIKPMINALPKLHLLSIGTIDSLSSKAFCGINHPNLEYFSASSIHNPDVLYPNLKGIRVLKLHGNDLSDRTIKPIIDGLEGNSDIWSLDVSSNKITDDSLSELVRTLYQDFDVHSEAYFFVEGRLINPSLRGHHKFGPFEVIQESQHSYMFNHPDRYFADTPSYRLVARENSPIRTNGRDEPWDDSLQAMSDIYSRYGPDTRFPPRSITHLNVSDNCLTTLGIERMLRESRGFIEVLSCSGTSVYTAVRGNGVWKCDDKLFGLFNVSHLLRPVYSSNLRHLTVHHSIVTQLPTLESHDLTPFEALWYTEKCLLPNIHIMYPDNSFKPDMNPRLSQLTLTNVPQRSCGHVIKALTNFIKLLATQEQEIKEATFAEGRLAPLMLKGMRVLRLEMDLDPLQDPSMFALSLEQRIASMSRLTSDYSHFVTLQMPSQPSTPVSTVPPNEETFKSNLAATLPDAPLPPPPLFEPPSFDSFFNPPSFGPPPFDPPAYEPPSYEVAAVLASQSAGSSSSSSTLPPQPAPIRKEAQKVARDATAALRSKQNTPKGKAPSKPSSTPQKSSDRYVSISSHWGNEPYITQVWAGRDYTAKSANVPPAIRSYTDAAANPALQKVPGPPTPAQVRAGVPKTSKIFHDAWESCILPSKGKVTRPSINEETTARNMLDVISELKKWRMTPEGKLWTGKLEFVLPTNSIAIDMSGKVDGKW